MTPILMIDFLVLFKARYCSKIVLKLNFYAFPNDIEKRLKSVENKRSIASFQFKQKCKSKDM